MILRIEVLGTPAPQGSKKGYVRGGRAVLVESSKAVQPWREAIVSQCIRSGASGLMLDGPIHVDIAFRLKRPAGHTGKKGLLKSAPIKPWRGLDLDKLVRSTLDGITQAGVWVDDSRVVLLRAVKVYADDRPTGASIVIEAMGAE